MTKMKRGLSLPTHATADRVRVIIEKLKLKGPVIGTDEAGRGPLAGPVTAAAVWLTDEQERALLAMGLRDSKRMTPKSREAIFEAMKQMGVLWRAQVGEPDMIERVNILRAALWAMERSVWRLAKAMPERPRTVAVDGPVRLTGIEWEQWTLVAADSLIPVVSAASVVAKILRDRIMAKMDERYPGYGFAQHKGYPTKMHREAVMRLGLSPIHRRLFCRKLLLEKNERESLKLFPIENK